jgi:hypothetical protein
MKLEDFKGLTQEILGNLSDQAKISGILMTMSEDYGAQLAQLEQMSTKVAEQEGNIKSLQQTNMDLFLKITSPIPGGGEGDKKQENNMSFDDLLDKWK